MHQQPPLPYAEDALAPYISSKTIHLHFHKHHKGYFDKLNSLIANTAYAKDDLTTLVRTSKGPIFNNAAQAWNHIQYWSSLSPNTNQTPQGELLNAIIRDFGSVDTLKLNLTQTALNTFGAGWTWLVLTPNNKLKVLSTANAHNPLEQTGMTTLLACDVWEHAYYLDTQNDRSSYLDHFWKVCNWEHALKQFTHR